MDVLCQKLDYSEDPKDLLQRSRVLVRCPASPLCPRTECICGLDRLRRGVGQEVDRESGAIETVLPARDAKDFARAAQLERVLINTEAMELKLVEKGNSAANGAFLRSAHSPQQCLRSIERPRAADKR